MAHPSAINSTLPLDGSVPSTPTPVPHNDCADCRKRKKCALHATMKIGRRMAPGTACDTCKKQKKKCRGYSCTRALGSKSTNQSPSASRPLFFETVDAEQTSTGFTFIQDPHPNGIFMTVTSYRTPDAESSFHQSLGLGLYTPDLEFSPTLFQMPYYLTSMPFATLVRDQIRRTQPGIQTNELEQNLQRFRLPSAWNSEDRCKRLELNLDGTVVEYKGIFKLVILCHLYDTMSLLSSILNADSPLIFFKKTATILVTF